MAYTDSDRAKEISAAFRDKHRSPLARINLIKKHFADIRAYNSYDVRAELDAKYAALRKAAEERGRQCAYSYPKDKTLECSSCGNEAICAALAALPKEAEGK